MSIFLFIVLYRVRGVVVGGNFPRSKNIQAQIKIDDSECHQTVNKNLGGNRNREKILGTRNRNLGSIEIEL